MLICDFFRYMLPFYAAEAVEGAEEPSSAGANVAATEVAETVDPIDAIISKALEGRGDDGEIITPEPDAAAPEARKRGPDGRFTNPTEDAPGDAGPADAGTKSAQPGTEQPAPIAQSLPVPDNWPAEHKSAFAKLPPDGQKFVLDRHQEMQADYTRKTQEIAEFRKSAEPLLKAVEPFSEYIRQLGWAPANVVGTLIAAERTLRTGTPQEKAAKLAQLSVDYGVPLIEAHNLIQQGQVNRPIPLNPQHQQAIQQQNQRLEAIEQHNADRARQEQSRQASAEIESFRSAKTADGQPKYPQYDRVIGSMSDWLGSDPKELAGKSLPEMLDIAYARFGKPIDDGIKEQVAARQKAASEANAVNVAKAKAASSPRSNGSAPRGSATGRDLGTIIDQAYSKVMGASG